MLCTECQKRPATIHFTQIINGKKTEVNMCEVCAQAEGYPIHAEESFTLHDLLTGLFKASSQSKAGPMSINNQTLFDNLGQLSCDHCQLSFSDFQRIGKFGCAHCYDSFKPRLDAVIRRVHSGNKQHQGKIPKRKGGKLHKKKQLLKYREYLQRLIEEENFEEAAVIRDQIKALEAEEGSHDS